MERKRGQAAGDSRVSTGGGRLAWIGTVIGLASVSTISSSL